MDIHILCPLWGHEQTDIDEFAARVKGAGYDGIDAWVPEDRRARDRFHNALARQGLSLVTHQHQGTDTRSFLHYLEICAEGSPLLINSHTGRDYFSEAENLAFIDAAADFSRERSVLVAHETHRGRLGFSPGDGQRYFDARPEMVITADLSHWVCVTESFLEGFRDTLEEALRRTRHIHARVGYEEGPQVPDPRVPAWAGATERFLVWWRRIADLRRAEGASLLTVTAEFGPPPYMPTDPRSGQPLASQWEINAYMKDLLRAHLAR